MKNTFKYLILFASLTFYVCESSAQQSTTTIAANANIIGDVTVAASTDGLQFGLVIKDSQKRINVIDGAVDVTGGSITGISGNEKRGYFEIDGTVGTKINLKVSVPSKLNHSDGSTSSMDYIVNTDTTDTDILIDEIDPSGGTDYTSEELLATQNVSNSTFDLGSGVYSYSYNGIIIPGTAGEERKIYMVIGGLVKAASSQKAGVYSADIELTTTIVSD
jgi:hypothetical protein